MNIIYLRTSTEEQNPENQLRDCQSINKYGESKVIQDKQSAWNDDKVREGFEELKKLIKSRSVENLIIWDLDRLYRNRKRLIEFFEICKVYKVSIHSFRQQWLNQLNSLPSPFNEIMFDLMLQIMGWLGEEESTKKSERIKIAIRRDSGITKSYKGNKWGRKTLNDSLINQILDLHKQGKTIREISSSVYYWDKSNNKKYVSNGFVHKTISKPKL